MTLELPLDPTSRFIVITVLCGVGTALMRILPMAGTARRRSQARESSPSTGLRGWLQRLIEAIGPAAIVALLLANLWPPGGLWPAWGPRATATLAGLAAVAAIKLTRGGLALPTLVGAAAYALVAAAGRLS